MAAPPGAAVATRVATVTPATRVRRAAGLASSVAPGAPTVRDVRSATRAPSRAGPTGCPCPAVASPATISAAAVRARTRGVPPSASPTRPPEATAAATRAVGTAGPTLDLATLGARTRRPRRVVTPAIAAASLAALFSGISARTYRLRTVIRATIAVASARLAPTYGRPIAVR